MTEKIYSDDGKGMHEHIADLQTQIAAVPAYATLQNQLDELKIELANADLTINNQAAEISQLKALLDAKKD